jgi:hypothetical protein
LKKNRLFILLSTVTAICIFAVAASCNLCGVPVSVGNTLDTINDTSGKTELTDISTESTDQTKVTSATEQSSKNEKENRSPVISDITLSSAIIEINSYYGVTVNATDPDGDSLTYEWHISNGTMNFDNTGFLAGPSVGDCTIQVKVTDGKGGEATKSKTFIVSQPSVITMDVPKIAAEGGHMEKGGAVNVGDALYAGDSLANKPCFGFISFDITSLIGKPHPANIQSASVVFSLSDQHGDPSFFASLALSEYYWGDRAIKSSDAEAAGNILQTFLLSDSTFSCSNAALKDALQNAINAERPRFQLRIYFIGITSDEDSQLDGWVYQQNNVKLSTTYTPGS